MDMMHFNCFFKIIIIISHTEETEAALGVVYFWEVIVL